MTSIYLTDQVNGHPDIKNVSNEIMFSVSDFYKNPQKAVGYRAQFSDSHKLAEDSGGFQFLMGKLPLEKCDPLKTIEIYKKIGVTRKDFPIQLDLPPRYSLSKQERISLIVKSAMFYHVMAQEIDWTIAVVHGWTYEELKLSLELIEHPEILQKIAVGSYKAIVQGINLFDKRFAVGTNLPISKGVQYVMDHLNSKRKVIGSGAFNIKPGYGFSSSRTVAVGTFNVSTTPKLHFTGGKQPRIIGIGANQQSGRYMLDEAGSLKKNIACANCTAEQVVQKAPQKVVWERLALVLNMFRNRELFMLGAASPHDQHMIFLGGATYGDTSAWRLKAYLAEIYVPEHGSVSIGHKKNMPRPKDQHLEILKGCLRETTHPLHGMNLKRFLTIGSMSMPEWRETFANNQWEIKPFDLRALHNAWVLKFKEEVIARQFANDPDSYYSYLRNIRFKNRPNLLRKLNFLWRRFKQPYVQSTVDLFLKGV